MAVMREQAGRPVPLKSMRMMAEHTLYSYIWVYFGDPTLQSDIGGPASLCAPFAFTFASC